MSKRIPNAARIVAALMVCCALAFTIPTHTQQRAYTEGFALHGHWVIEIRNPDGTMHGRFEFDNAFAGQADVAAVLARVGAPHTYSVGLYADDGPCRDASNAPAPCYIEEGGGTTTGPNYFTGLTVTWNAWDSHFVISGSAVAAAATSINRVASFLLHTGLGANTFSDTNLGTPIAVLPNQQVLITITYTVT